MTRDAAPATKAPPRPAEKKRSPGQIVGGYWRERSDLLYYKYLDYVVRTVGADAKTLLDVGSRDCGYLEWFDWFDERVSIDLVKPYTSKTVTGLQVDFFDYDPGRRFDIAICSQVLEHVPNVERFCAKLRAIADHVVITVPYRWPPGNTPGHVQDPVDEKKVRGWMERDPNHMLIVEEPFRRIKSRRMIAYYDIADPKRRIDATDIRARRPNRFV